MRVKDIMTPNPVAVRVDTNLAQAADLMWTANCGALPVVDGGRVIGMITDRDICIALCTRNRMPSEVEVGEVCEWKLFSCSPDDEVRDALATMRSWKVRRLPVIGPDDALEGILSLSDAVLNASKRQGELTYQDVAETLRAICEHVEAGAAAGARR